MAGRRRTAPTFSGQATSAQFESLPKGRIGYTNIDGDFAGIDDSGQTLAVVNGVTILSNRLVTVRAFMNISVDADDAHSTVSITLAQGSADNQIAAANYRLPPNANEQQGCWVEGDADPSAGTFDFYFRAQRVHGSQTLTAQGSTESAGFLKIFDDGIEF